MRKLLKIILAGVTGFVFYSSSYAATYSLGDFAHSTELTPATTSLREVDLPLSVYEKMQRQDFGDLRIFSADGQLVPYQLSRVSTVNTQQQNDLVFYPFTREQATDSANIKVIINQKMRQNNSVQKDSWQKDIRINHKWGDDDSKNTSVTSGSNKRKEYQYIIENPQTKTQLCALKLDWLQSEPSVILPLTLESSNDLQNWSMLSRKQSVSKLNYSGSHLIQDEISFSCTSQKYLRLTWLNPQLQVRLKKIQGTYKQNGIQQTQWQSFGKPKYDKEGSWLFESNVVAGITQMEFKAPYDGLLYKGALYSRNRDNDQWTLINDVTQYRLNLGNSVETELQSSPFTIPSNNNRYWKFIHRTEGRFTEQQLPEILTAWTPRKLLFLAQGNGPFTLAFGHPNVQPSEQNDLNDLVKTIRDSGSAVDNVKLGKINNSGKIIIPQTPWKLIVFWIVLLLGTLLMAYMAFKLFKQMGEKEVK